MRARNDVGQVLPLVALVMVLAVGACAALGLGGRLVVARAQAQTAAARAETVNLVHGEQPPREAFKKTIEQPGRIVNMPGEGDTVEMR